MSNYSDAIQSMWIGRMTVYNTVKTVDADTGITNFAENTLYSNQPCRLSFSNISAGNENEGKQDITQSIKIFCSPSLVIPAGSKISVTQNGVTTLYQSSGQSAVYTEHQEIPLILYEKRA